MGAGCVANKKNEKYIEVQERETNTATCHVCLDVPQDDGNNNFLSISHSEFC